MKLKKHNVVFQILILIIILLGTFSSPKPIHAQVGTAYDMINGVNELRALNGLAPLSINGALMASAQAHADWITETGLGGHEGVDGTYAVDRAIIAGYGGGAKVYVNENWARGYNLSIYDCIYVSWNDPDHMGNMLTIYHNEIGAGVSIDSQNRVTYVLNVGHVSGSVEPLPETTLVPTQPQITYAPYLQPSTPNADGSIMHTVRYGEFLITIAEAYGITLSELLALNNLTMDSPIYPNDVLIIKVGETQEPTEVIPPTPTRTPTLRATPTPRPSLTPVLTQTPTPKPERSPGVITRMFSGNAKYLAIGLIGISLVGIVLLVVSSKRIH